jgi:hypothetical protein
MANCGVLFIVLLNFLFVQARKHSFILSIYSYCITLSAVFLENNAGNVLEKSYGRLAEEPLALGSKAAALSK